MLTASKLWVPLLLAMGAILAENPDQVISAFRGGFDITGALVPVSEIRYGGPRRDGIPTIDEPRFDSAAESILEDGDLVLGIFLDGIARAYPVAILARHLVVNDRIDGKSVSVTYCPLCGAGMIFSTTASDNHITFGISGLVYNSETLLYDRQTGSLWSPMLRGAVSGPFKGVRLIPYPVMRTTWKDWRTRYPDSQVLAEPRGSRFNYDQDPYAAYRRSKQLWYPVSVTSDLYPAKELVLGIVGESGARAYPFSELAYSETGVEDTLDGEPIRISWSKTDGIAQAFDLEGHVIPSVVAYWFSWYAFHPDTSVYIYPDKPEESKD